MLKVKPKYTIVAQDMKNKGFTLIELAIVLVITGLMIGGVIAGRSLVAQAAIRKDMKSFATYKLATETFRMKFGKYPGDYNMAQETWPECSDAPDLNSTVVTCDGNGDDQLSRTELFFVFEHLSRSQLIEDGYRGWNEDGVENFSFSPKLSTTGQNFVPVDFTTGHYGYYHNMPASGRGFVFLFNPDPYQISVDVGF